MSERLFSAKCLPVLLESRDGCICGGLIFKTPNGDPFLTRQREERMLCLKQGLPGLSGGHDRGGWRSTSGGVLVGAQGSWSKRSQEHIPLLFFFLIWRIPQEPRQERCSIGFSFFYLKWHSIRDGSLRESILSCLEFIKCFNKKEQVEVTWTVSAPWSILSLPLPEATWSKARDEAFLEISNIFSKFLIPSLSPPQNGIRFSYF